MAGTFPLRIDSFRPGIRRDGTIFEGPDWSDGQWVRFDRGRPRKMKGYRSISYNLSNPARQLATQTQSGYSYIHSGNSGGIDAFVVASSGSSIGLVAQTSMRTPTSFVPDPNVSWQFATIYDPATSLQQLVGVANYSQLDPNNTCVGNGTFNATSGNSLNIYNGSVYAATPLTPLASPPNGTNGSPESATTAGVSGGIVVLNPYTILYGANGYFAWSSPSAPLNFQSSGAGAANVTAQKILRGLPLRGGGGYSPAGLFWSVDSLVRATFVGSPNIWQWDTLSAETSLLNANCVVEVDGAFYWAGADGRFYMYNGAVTEIPNEMNLNWFFDGINQTYIGKAFAFRNPRWGEVWWCYPRGSATECSHAVIYNTRLRRWYDTVLPGQGRSFGILGDGQLGPIMADAATNNSGTTNSVYSLSTGSTTTILTNASHGWSVGNDVAFSSIGGTTQLNGTTSIITSIGTAQTITGITKAASAVVTINTVSASNPVLIGEIMSFAGVVGMTQINGLNGTVSATGGSSGAWTFTVNINSSGFTAYSSAGTATPTNMLVFNINSTSYGAYTSGGTLTLQLFTLWKHETGTDVVDGSNTYPIDAYIETGILTLLDSQQPSFASISSSFLESDFVQSGPLTVVVRGQSSAESTNYDSSPYPISQGPVSGTTAVTPLKESRRLMRLRFESNTVGGDFQMGRCVMHATADSKRITA